MVAVVVPPAGDAARHQPHGKRPLSKTKSLSTAGAAAPQKKGLHRTASLVPGGMAAPETQKLARHNHDALQNSNNMRLAAAHNSRTNAARSNLTRSSSPNVLLTNPAGQLERFDTGDVTRRGSRAGGSPVTGGAGSGAGSNYSSPRRTPSPIEQLRTGVEQYLQLPQPSQQLVNSAALIDGHMTLRNVLSDPSGYYTQFVPQPPPPQQHMYNQSSEDLTEQLRRHANLQLQQQRLLAEEVKAKSSSFPDFNMTAAEGGMSSCKKTPHRQLQRQLSLKGPEDPRLAAKVSSCHSSQVPLAAASQHQQPVPVVTFHGTQLPVSDRQQVPGYYFPSGGGGGGYQSDQQVMLMTQALQAQQQQQLAVTRANENLHRNLLQKSMAVNAMYADDATLAAAAAAHRAAAAAAPSAPAASRVHAPVGRISSAPGAFASSSAMQQESAGSSVASGKPPTAARLPRQNSTSDSNLAAMPGLFGDPRWSFTGGGAFGGELARDQTHYQSDPHGLRELVGCSSGGGKSADTPDILSMPGIKVAFGAAQPPKQQLSLDVSKQLPATSQLEASAAGRMTPGAPAKHTAGIQPSFHQTHLAAGENLNVFGAPLGLQQSSLNASSEELRKLIQLEQEELEKKKSLLSQHQHQLELQQQQLELQQLELQHKQQLELQQKQLELLSAPSPPPHPDGAGAPDDDMPVPPSDPRYLTYHHLCGLFDEGHVRRVMNSHPDETNPAVLCSYLCGGAAAATSGK